MAGDKFAKTQAGRPLEIPAPTWNAMVDAARAHASRQHDQNEPAESLFRQGDIVKIRNQSGTDLNRFAVLGIGGPIIEPTASERSFKNEVAINGITPADDHRGRFAILLDPLRAGRIGRAWLSGICPVRINVTDDWHQYADIEAGSTQSLISKPAGAAQILWRESGVGVKWAVVRLSHSHRSFFLAKVPAAGIPARVGTLTGSATCELYEVSDTGAIEPLVRPGGETVQVTVRHHGLQPIRSPLADEPHYLGVRFDGRDSWILDPAKQTLLCKPLRRLRPKTWGAARELRFQDGSWQATGSVVQVYNVCEYTLLPKQQIVCHFHEDTSAYLTIGCRCCDGSSSSGSSSSGSSASSVSSSSSSDSSTTSSSSSSPSSSSSDSSSSLSSSASASSSSSSRSNSNSAPSLGSASDSSTSSMSSSGSVSSSGSRSQSSIESSSGSGGSSLSDLSNSASSSRSDSSSASPSSSGSSASSSSDKSSSDASSSDSESSESASESLPSTSDPRRSVGSSDPSSGSMSISHSRSGSGSPSDSVSGSASASASDSRSDSTSASESDSASHSRSDSHSESRSESLSEPSASESEPPSESDEPSDSERPSDSAIPSYSEAASSEAPSYSTSDSSPSTSGSLPSTSESTRSISDSEPPSESEPPPSESEPPSESSEPPSESERPSYSEPPPGSSDGSSTSCSTTWIWSCGWDLLDSTCDDPGDPPSESGSYDGEIQEVAA